MHSRTAQHLVPVALITTLCVAFLSACGSGDDTHEPWFNAKTGETVRVEVGDSHCGFESVLMLSVDGEMYVRDPDGVVPQNQKLTRFVEESVVPSSAVDTGFRREDSELWMADDSGAIFVEESAGTEQWPQVERGWGCD